MGSGDKLWLLADFKWGQAGGWDHTNSHGWSLQAACGLQPGCLQAVMGPSKLACRFA